MKDKKEFNVEEIPQDVETVVETEEKAEDLHGENLGDRVRTLSPTMLVMKRFFRSKLSIIGLVTLIFLFTFSFIGPFFSHWQKGGDPVIDTVAVTRNETVNPLPVIYRDAEGNKITAYIIDEHAPDINMNAGMSFITEIYTDEAKTQTKKVLGHWLGTNDLGQDLFTNLMLGGRVSLTIGFVVVFLEALIGIILGGLAGYFGGWVDNVIMRLVDILSCIPTIPIMLILSSILDSKGIEGMIRLYILMAMLTLFGWTGIARLVRGQILSLREQEFMLAAKASGLSVPRKIFKHLLPNVMPQLIVSMTMGLGSIILTEATLGFLGLGVPMGTPTWGSMINAATKQYILKSYPNFWIPPGICITLAILAFNFVGDGLRDAFDPKMKR